MKYNMSEIMKNAWSMMTKDTLFSECLKESWKLARNNSEESKMKAELLNNNDENNNIEFVELMLDVKLSEEQKERITKRHKYFVDFINKLTEKGIKNEYYKMKNTSPCFYFA